jgi:hypothetical protein
MRERQLISQGDELLPGVLNSVLIPGFKPEQLTHGVLVEVNGVGQGQSLRL